MVWLFSLNSDTSLLEISWQSDRLVLNLVKQIEDNCSPSIPMYDENILYSLMEERKNQMLEKAKAWATPFEYRVWQATTEVPFGEKISYQELAIKIGTPKSYRAVGNALGKNRFAPFIPCHRIISSDGGLGGYAFGLSVKRLLLQWEQHVKQASQSI